MAVTRRAFLALASALGLAGCSDSPVTQPDKAVQDEEPTSTRPDRYFNENGELVANVNNPVTKTETASINQSGENTAIIDCGKL